MSEPKVWTVEDTRNLLKGVPAQVTPEADVIPPDAVSVTIETVVEDEMQTTETVKTMVPRRAAKASPLPGGTG